MAWKELADFDGTINGHKMTVRVTKSDDSVKPKYSIAIGTRNDPNPFRPFLRGDLLNMTGNAAVEGLEPWEGTGQSVLDILLTLTRKKVELDTIEHNAKLKEAEQKRIALLNGKRQGDPKANTGLSRFKKKHREKQAAESD